MICRDENAGVDRRIQPALLGQPVSFHIAQGRRIGFNVHVPALVMGIGSDGLHPGHGVAVRRELKGGQEKFCKLRLGDGVVGVKAPVRVAVHPALGHGLLDLPLGPVALNVAELGLLSRRRGGRCCRDQQRRGQQAAEQAFHIFSHGKTPSKQDKLHVYHTAAALPCQFSVLGLRVSRFRIIIEQ